MQRVEGDLKPTHLQLVLQIQQAESENLNCWSTFAELQAEDVASSGGVEEFVSMASDVQRQFAETANDIFRNFLASGKQ